MREYIIASIVLSQKCHHFKMQQARESKVGGGGGTRFFLWGRGVTQSGVTFFTSSSFKTRTASTSARYRIPISVEGTCWFRGWGWSESVALVGIGKIDTADTGTGLVWLIAGFTCPTSEAAADAIGTDSVSGTVVRGTCF